MVNSISIVRFYIYDVPMEISIVFKLNDTFAWVPLGSADQYYQTLYSTGITLGH